jgi:drug/metabolite transporter (DMT)-like permease
MAALLGLLAAVTYGIGDFSAGLAARRFPSGAVTACAQALGLATACVALVLFPGHGPTARILAWGALSGVGSTIGTFSLYHGLGVGRMSVVATLSAVLTAVIPVLTGVALGNRLGLAAIAGIVIAVPSIALVSWHGSAGESGASGARYGLVAGVGFSLLFIALDRAGTRGGAWPLLPGQAVSLVLLLPFALRDLRAAPRPSARTLELLLIGGVLSGTGNLLFLAATGHGALAVVAVLTALYPAVTVLLARAFLAERWTRRQAIGLAAAAAAIVLVSVR